MKSRVHSSPLLALVLAFVVAPAFGQPKDPKTDPKADPVPKVDPVPKTDPAVQKLTDDVAALKASLDKTKKELDASIAEAQKNLEAAKAAAANAATKDDVAKVKADAAKAVGDAVAPVKTELADLKKAPAGGVQAKDIDALKADIKKDGEERTKALDELTKSASEAGNKGADAQKRGDTAWMLASSALVMLMLPGLALFYGGMVRRKNVLATMMQSMAALAVVGVCLVRVRLRPGLRPVADQDRGRWRRHHRLDVGSVLPEGTSRWTITSRTTTSRSTSTCMFQGMFAIITPALITGALAERIRFWPFCIFMMLWVTVVYCPLAHMVWAFDWFNFDPGGRQDGSATAPSASSARWGRWTSPAARSSTSPPGMAGLAGCSGAAQAARLPGTRHAPQQHGADAARGRAAVVRLVRLQRRVGARRRNPLAGSAFAATQAAAAAAGLSWMLVEWLVKGKPTALGLASGIVAGLVAVTPACGYVYIWGGVVIGILAGVVCYFAVPLKAMFGYDDSLDAFGVHGVGGFLGAVLTGVFCYAAVNSLGADGYFAVKSNRARVETLKKEYPGLEAALKAKDAAADADAEKDPTKKAELTKAADAAKAMIDGADPAWAAEMKKSKDEADAAKKKADEADDAQKKDAGLESDKAAFVLDAKGKKFDAALKEYENLEKTVLPGYKDKEPRAADAGVDPVEGGRPLDGRGVRPELRAGAAGPGADPEATSPRARRRRTRGWTSRSTAKSGSTSAWPATRCRSRPGPSRRRPSRPPVGEAVRRRHRRGRERRHDARLVGPVQADRRADRPGFPGRLPVRHDGPGEPLPAAGRQPEGARRGVPAAVPEAARQERQGPRRGVIE